MLIILDTVYTAQYTHMWTATEFCSSVETVAGKVSIAVLISLFTCDKDGNKLLELKSSPFVIVENGKGDATLWDEIDSLLFIAIC